MGQWDHIAQAIDECTPILRKFDPEEEGEVLDRIDAYSAAAAGPRCLREAHAVLGFD